MGLPFLAAQWRRGYVHRSNHDGTGYGKSYNFDFRLHGQAPPGFHDGEFPDISGSYDRLLFVGGRYTVHNAIVNELTVLPGAEIVLEGRNALTIRRSLRIEASQEEPVVIRPRYRDDRPVIRSQVRLVMRCVLRHVQVAPNVEIRLSGDSLNVSKCRFDGFTALEGGIHVDSSWFSGNMELTAWEGLQVTRSVFEEGISVNGDVRNGLLQNNTIVGAGDTGVRLDGFYSVRLVNNIIVFNGKGVVNDHWEQPELEFNDVFANAADNYQGCSPAEGSISADPLFVDPANGDYRLRPNSPCIDAGDPNSPRDPDGTRADIGAFPYDRELSVNPGDLAPEEFNVSIAPNPFNDRTIVTISGIPTGELQFTLYDIRGRQIWNQSQRTTGGSQTIALTGSLLKAPGVYFAEVKGGSQRRTAKLVYLP